MNVLFVCVGNSGRSVMAERLFAQSVGDRHAVRSRGLDARETAAEASVVTVLQEVGIDATDHVPRQLDDADLEWADIVVSVCSSGCPVVDGKRNQNWGITDPWGRPVEGVREIRDEIAGHVEELSAELG